MPEKTKAHSINNLLVTKHDLYAQLKRIAKQSKAKVMAKQAVQQLVGQELNFHSTTAVVHEVFLKLSQNKSHLISDDEKALLAQLGKVVRSVLIDLIRKQQAQKRDASPVLPTEPNIKLIFAVEAVLEKTHDQFARQCNVAVLHYFNGLKVEHISLLLEISEATVYNDLKFFKALVNAELDRLPAECG